MRYSIHNYPLSTEFIQSLTRLDTRKSLETLALGWVSTFALIYAVRFLIPSNLFWYFYVPAIFLIAGRIGFLLQFAHEGAHFLISRNKRVNHFVSTWLCALPIGINFDGYAKDHKRHHAFTNTDQDPKSDTEKYRITNFYDPRLYLLFIKDLLGITALSIFFTYDKKGEKSARVQGKQGGWIAHLKNFAALCLVQTLLLGLLFHFNLRDYILLWLVPAVCPHMFLMRIRGIAEHGLSKQLGIETVTNSAIGTLNTRSFLTPMNQYGWSPLTWLEKALIGSLAVHYHHEHHLLTNVPFYNLKRLHQHVASEVSVNNPNVYAKGYFSAALRNLIDTKLPLPTPQPIS